MHPLINGVIILVIFTQKFFLNPILYLRCTTFNKYIYNHKSNFEIYLDVPIHITYVLSISNIHMYILNKFLY